jgi:crotonobetainyl-CoA:carnitine CoA-transferase CaiB-like acyl-CoA transferase
MRFEYARTTCSISGERSETVLGEYGYSADEIIAMRADGAI